MPNHGLGFTTAAPGLPSRDSSASAMARNNTPHAASKEFQLGESNDELAFARRILSSPPSDELYFPRSRTVSTSSPSSAATQYAYQQSSPEAGPSSPPRSSLSASAGGPPQLPPRRRSNRGSSSIESRQSISLSASSGHRHAPSDPSPEKQALAKLVSMYENLVSPRVWQNGSSLDP